MVKKKNSILKRQNLNRKKKQNETKRKWKKNDATKTKFLFCLTLGTARETKRTNKTLDNPRVEHNERNKKIEQNERGSKDEKKNIFCARVFNFAVHVDIFVCITMFFYRACVRLCVTFNESRLKSQFYLLNLLNSFWFFHNRKKIPKKKTKMIIKTWNKFSVKRWTSNEIKLLFS